ncbi:hypothetical protein, partial [Tritonibacter sp. SIMBA_163]|uniref:hypothetical protein n=1 Tax=Tritonibacter sp. SIMBA_163 TaxID=3080868 RepID=UPI0039804EA6
MPTYIIRDVVRGALGQRLDIVSEVERKLSARLVHGEALGRCVDGARERTLCEAASQSRRSARTA